MLELKQGIFYVGVKDDIRGTYNNAYLIKGEKTALIDTVLFELSVEYIKNIEEIIPVQDIDYLICNHTEPDKSGAVGEILKLNPDITVIGTIAGIKNIKEIVNTEFKEQIAKNGAVIDLGNGKRVEFSILPNLNWPDTMVTYEKQTKVLFSCDIFSAYYDCDTGMDSNKHEAAMRCYYDDKLSQYSKFVKTAMNKLLQLDITDIYTGYGPIISDKITDVINKYLKWSDIVSSKEKTVVVFYASNYGYTKEMAEIVTNTIKDFVFEVKCYDYCKTDINTMISALNSADALAFGTPTLNRNAAKPMWELISNTDMVNMRNKPYFVFGSYGWGGEGLMLVHNQLEEMKLRPFSKPFGSILKLSDEKKTELLKYVKKFTESIKKEI